jgi:hypothetical protein
MIKSADKKRKEIVYNPGDLVFLSSRNIKTAHREHAMRWACRWQASEIIDLHLLVISGVK